MIRVIDFLKGQINNIMIQHPKDVEEDTYWRGVKVGLETAINYSEEIRHIFNNRLVCIGYTGLMNCF